MATSKTESFKDCIGQDVCVGDICIAFIGTMNSNGVEQKVILITKMFRYDTGHIRFDAESLTEKFHWWTGGPFATIRIEPMFHLENRDVALILEKKRKMGL